LNYAATEVVTDLPLLDEVNDDSIAAFKQWMEHKRYSETSLQKVLKHALDNAKNQKTSNAFIGCGVLMQHIYWKR